MSGGSGAASYCGAGTSKTANTYWAGPDGYPLRAVIGPGMEVVLDVK